MKRILLIFLSLAAMSACGSTRNTLTPESRSAWNRLHHIEKIMCPTELFTNCTLEAVFSATEMRDGMTNSFTGRMLTSNRCFNFAHSYIGQRFDEPVSVTTGCDTVGYGARLERWIKLPLDAECLLTPLSRERFMKNVGAQLEYRGTEADVSRYRLYYLTGETPVPVECNYWCDIRTRCITRATSRFVLDDGTSVMYEVQLNPYSGIGRNSYPQDACYLKFARQIDYRITRPDGSTLIVTLHNLRLEDIGVYKTGRKTE